MQRRIRAAAVCAATCITLAAYSGYAEDHKSTPGSETRTPGDVLSTQAISERAQQERTGKITEIELERKHGRRIYEVEMVDDAGAKWELHFDAKTGELLSSKADDDDADHEDDDDD